MIEIPNLTIDRDGDDPDTQVMLTQEFGGNEHMVTLHPIQVRLLAERMGFLEPSSNIEADRTIARLCRQMRTLLGRIDQLDDWLNQTAQRGHENLDMETTYSFATWELASEFVKELPDASRAAAAVSRQAQEPVPSVAHPAEQGGNAPAPAPAPAADGQLPLEAGATA